MIEQFLKLLERFVVAHELLAANSAKQPSVVTVENNTTKPVEINVEGEDVIDTPAPEEKHKRKPRKVKEKEEAADIDYADLRKQLTALDDAIAEDGSDKVNDELEALYDSYDAQTISEIKDSDLVEVLAEVTKLKDKYFE